jgi:hypothetical protein
MASSVRRSGPHSARSPAMTRTWVTPASPLSRQEIVERGDAGEIAHGDVGHRLEAGGPHQDRRTERFVRRPVRHRAEINARAALEGRERSDVGVRRPCRLDGKTVHERGDARDRIERRLILSCERGHLSVLALLTRSE